MPIWEEEWLEYRAMGFIPNFPPETPQSLQPHLSSGFLLVFTPGIKVLVLLADIQRQMGSLSFLSFISLLWEKKIRLWGGKKTLFTPSMIFFKNYLFHYFSSCCWSRSANSVQDFPSRKKPHSWSFYTRSLLLEFSSWPKKAWQSKKNTPWVVGWNLILVGHIESGVYKLWGVVQTDHTPQNLQPHPWTCPHFHSFFGQPGIVSPCSVAPVPLKYSSFSPLTFLHLPIPGIFPYLFEVLIIF